MFFYLRLIAKQLDEKGTGTTFKAISGDILRNEAINLPPLPEQRAIVAKVEQLFSDLDNGIANLKKAQEQLKTYRQAVLKWAFEGKLTEEWRTSKNEKGKIKNGEAAKELLERIRAEREEHAKATGKKLKPVKPLTDKELAELPEIPEGWAWVRLDEITENHDGKRVPVKRTDRDQMEGRYPYYGASGIIDYVNDYLFDGEYLLIAEDGANLLARSTPIAFQARGRFWVNNHAHVVTTSGSIPFSYLEHYLNSIDISRYVTGTAQPKLTQNFLNKIPVPVALLAEQQAIVQEIETRFSVCDNIEANIKDALEKSEALRQSILKKAFEGKLLSAEELEAVRRSPDWEPAEKLLERIRAEREEKEKAEEKKKEKEKKKKKHKD